MKKYILAVSLLAAMTTFQACGNKETEENKVAEETNEQQFDDTHMEEDAEFAFKAAADGMMEVELGNIALTNGSSAAVKELGQMMVTEHTAANNELTALAQSKNISLPTSHTSDMQNRIDNLRKKTGAEFDKDYVDFMVKDHKDDIDLFEKEVNNGKDADIKAWASAKVAVLKHHLEITEATQAGLKN